MEGAYAKKGQGEKRRPKERGGKVEDILKWIPLKGGNNALVLQDAPPS